MKVAKIISEHKKRRSAAFCSPGGQPTSAPRGTKRVEAIVQIPGVGKVTRHIDVENHD